MLSTNVNIPLVWQFALLNFEFFYFLFYCTNLHETHNISNVIPPPIIEYDHVQLSDLEIIGTLGVGGFGRVELVQFNKKDTFALKILKKCDVASQGQIEHAYSEKEIMSSCDSPFIVKYD